MRHALLVVLVAACGSDELSGTWDSVDNEGRLVAGPVQTRWWFDDDGSYRYEAWSAWGIETEEGAWQRIDENVIHRSGSVTQMRVSDDGEYFLIDPDIFENGKWRIIRDHVCGTTGTRGVLEVYDNFTAHEHWQCDNRIYDCTGTWEDKPLGITIVWETRTCQTVEHLFRIRDGLGYPGFRRVF
jgi:hypothetical protein